MVCWRGSTAFSDALFVLNSFFRRMSPKVCKTNKQKKPDENIAMAKLCSLCYLLLTETSKAKHVKFKLYILSRYFSVRWTLQKEIANLVLGNK